MYVRSDTAHMHLKATCGGVGEEKLTSHRFIFLQRVFKNRSLSLQAFDFPKSRLIHIEKVTSNTACDKLWFHVSTVIERRQPVSRSVPSALKSV